MGSKAASEADSLVEEFSVLLSLDVPGQQKEAGPLCRQNYGALISKLDLDLYARPVF